MILAVCIRVGDLYHPQEFALSWADAADIKRQLRRDLRCRVVVVGVELGGTVGDT